ncbi:hypothetical protein P20311_3336 [Pseudoalteromonas sp. BSi20311]|nr:hypothetical protein P20311_3336 [Pseudoalteromonas sp. BSi20311]GAA71461.1 hypothetical protein P20439_1535 [Pseudoalteromonas sp. BSi20439]
MLHIRFYCYLNQVYDAGSVPLFKVLAIRILLSYMYPIKLNEMRIYIN